MIPVMFGYGFDNGNEKEPKSNNIDIGFKSKE
jgi:hypothetical protein